MSAHTPGPWVARVSPKVVTVKSQHVIGAGSNGMMSVAWLVGGKPGNDADARLIAAAPELLAALVALRATAFHSQHCPAFPPGCGAEPCRCGYDDAEQAAHDAVLRATGRSEAATPAARAAIAKARGER